MLKILKSNWGLLIMCLVFGLGGFSIALFSYLPIVKGWVPFEFTGDEAEMNFFYMFPMIPVIIIRYYFLGQTENFLHTSDLTLVLWLYPFIGIFFGSMFWKIIRKMNFEHF